MGNKELLRLLVASAIYEGGKRYQSAHPTPPSNQKEVEEFILAQADEVLTALSVVVGVIGPKEGGKIKPISA